MIYLINRKWTLLSIVVIVPVGLLCKLYSGPASSCVNDSLGGVFYEIFWCLLIFLFFKKVKPFNIAMIVFLVTCFLEFLQLWHPPFLQFLRSFFLGRTILGTSFTWTDFPYYFIGCIISYYWMKFLKRIES